MHLFKEHQIYADGPSPTQIGYCLNMLLKMFEKRLIWLKRYLVLVIVFLALDLAVEVTRDFFLLLG